MRPVGSAFRPALPTPSRLLAQTLRVVATWEKRRRTRKNLNALSAHLLCDIGLAPASATQKRDKPFCRA